MKNRSRSGFSVVRLRDRMPKDEEDRTLLCGNPGAIGLDWVTGGQGGVPRLISWPRKKLIKQ